MANLIKDIKTAMITNKVRFSYANVFKPRAANEGQEPKYSVSIIIPKEDEETIKLVKQCIKAAIDENRSKLGLKAGKPIPSSFKTPLRDGDEDKPDNEEYENCMFMNASSRRAPGVVKKVEGKAVPIDEEEFYSGCFGKVSINFYAYNVDGGKGIACGLNNILKTEDGERLGGGGSSAADDFGLEEEADEFM